MSHHDPLGSGNALNNDDIRQFETDNQVAFDGTIGRKIGSKYLVEYRTELRSDDNSVHEIRINRDLHDAVATLRFGVKTDSLSNKTETSDNTDSLQVRAQIKFKLAHEKGPEAVLKKTSSLFGSNPDSAKKSAFENLCRTQDMTPSQVVRRLIRDFMEQQEPAAPAAARRAAPRKVPPAPRKPR